MSRTRLKKKNSILKLKYVHEEHQITKEENQIGMLELNDILKDFSQRIKPTQKKQFDNLFFGDKNSANKNLSDTTEIIVANKKVEEEINRSAQSNLPKWVKTLYKQIVQRSHPDRYIGFPIQEIKEKFKNIYIDAVTAFEQQDIGIILLCAYDVEIDINQFPESETFITSSIELNQKKTNDLKNLIGYQWYHLIESNRKPFLEAYLSRLGYVFDSKKTEEAVKKVRIKRKVGTRPENLRVKSKKIK